MKRININDFIKSLDIDCPPEKEFLRLSRFTSLYPERNGSHIINYERGILLYSLIAKLKPKTVLEIGTAKGYSTLCMVGLWKIMI